MYNNHTANNITFTLPDGTFAAFISTIGWSKPSHGALYYIGGTADRNIVGFKFIGGDSNYYTPSYTITNNYINYIFTTTDTEFIIALIISIE